MALWSPLCVSKKDSVPVELKGKNGGGGEKKGNSVENRGLMLCSSVLSCLIPCVKSHPVLPTAQGVVGPAISTDAALFKHRITRHFTQNPRMRGGECGAGYGGLCFTIQWIEVTEVGVGCVAGEKMHAHSVSYDYEGTCCTTQYYWVVEEALAPLSSFFLGAEGQRAEQLWKRTFLSSVEWAGWDLCRSLPSRG